MAVVNRYRLQEIADYSETLIAGLRAKTLSGTGVEAGLVTIHRRLTEAVASIPEEPAPELAPTQEPAPTDE